MPFTTDTPQAAIPTRRDNHSLLRAAVTTQPEVKILGPRIVVGNGEVFSRKPFCAFRQLQNCGTNAVKYLVSNTGDCNEENFHGILAACSAVDDGLGSVQMFGITGERVTLFSASGTHRVAVFEGVAPEGP